MDQLSEEIMHLICAAIAPDFILDTESRRTLQELSQVNRAWHYIALPYLYRYLEILLTTPEDLTETVDRLLQPTCSGQYIRHLRRLDIVTRRSRLNLPSRRVRSPPILDFSPIVTFVSLVNRLKEMHYSVREPFPPILLDALHQHHPTCKLILWHLVLPFAVDEGRREHRRYDLALMSSPCLYGVHVYYERSIYRTDEYEDIHDQVALGLVLLAPNLQEVAINLKHFNSSIRNDISQVATFWSDAGVLAASHPGRLSSLSFSPNMRMTERRFQEWRRHTDMTCLREWDVGRVHDSHLPRAVVAASQAFTNLERLSICLKPRLDNGVEMDFDYWPTVEAMLENIPPLKHLSLVGYRDSAFLETVLAHHSTTLLTLKLADRTTYRFPNPTGPSFTGDDIHRLARLCPILRELEIDIKRMQGQLAETRAYEALGQFPSLVNLVLNLDCVPAGDDLDDNNNDNDTRAMLRAASLSPELPFGYAQRAFTNAAVDGVLALEIFDTILFNQPTRRLARLAVNPCFDEGPPHWIKRGGYSLTILFEVMRSWLVTRPALGYPGEVSVREKGSKTGERIGRPLGTEWCYPQLGQIVRRIWPQPEEGGSGLWWYSERLQRAN